jgi:2,4-dienoyl-CoA reductase-like NADH-dependent reductase (Old Yellow Enzyme family)
MKADESVGG